MVILLVINNQAETKIQLLQDINDGRSMLHVLDEQYLGYGVYSHEISKSENTTNNCFFSGKKPPTMYWDDFERHLLWAFRTYVKHHGINTLNNYMKLK